MDTSAVSATTTATTTSKATTRGFNDLGSDDFFKLLITELQSQDPMNPTDNQALMSQLSSIRQMEQTSTLNKTLKSLAAEQRFGATTSLIGQYVAGTVTNDSGDSYDIQGLVTSVRFDSDGEAILDLHNGSSLPASSVTEVTVVDNLPDELKQQLEAELAAASGSSSSAKSKKAATKTVVPAVTSAGNQVRGVAAKADKTASLVDALLAPDFK